jgi:hypothetical protein
MRQGHSGAPDEVRHIRVCVYGGLATPQLEAEEASEDYNEVHQPSKR